MSDAWRRVRATASSKRGTKSRSATKIPTRSATPLAAASRKRSGKKKRKAYHGSVYVVLTRTMSNYETDGLAKTTDLWQGRCRSFSLVYDVRGFAPFFIVDEIRDCSHHCDSYRRLCCKYLYVCRKDRTYCLQIYYIIYQCKYIK